MKKTVKKEIADLSRTYTDKDVEKFWDLSMETFGKDITKKHPMWEAFKLFMDMRGEDTEGE